MYKLYLVKGDDSRELIAESDSCRELRIRYQQHQKERGFSTAPFERCWLADEGEWIDFGNWSYLYLITGVTFEDICRND